MAALNKEEWIEEPYKFEINDKGELFIVEETHSLIKVKRERFPNNLINELKKVGDL